MRHNFHICDSENAIAYLHITNIPIFDARLRRFPWR